MGVNEHSIGISLKINKGRKPLGMDEAQKTDAEKSTSVIKISTVYNEYCLVKEKKN